MNSRERLLAIVVASVVALLGVKAAFDYVSDLFNDRQIQITKRTKEIADKQVTIDAANHAKKRITEWEHRSLPSDRQSAKTEYSNWLILTATKANLGDTDVNPLGAATNRANAKSAYEQYSFEVDGQSDIKMTQLIDFLYDFYASNQLHKIRELDVCLCADGKLDVKIFIDAIALPTADRGDKLSLTSPKQLSLGDLKAYQKAIADRNLFAEYTPPRERPSQPRNTTPPFDASKFTEVTGITTQQNDERLLWVIVKTTGDKYYLKEGEEFTVGGVKYKVVKIGLHDALVDADGKRKQVNVGGNLKDAALAPDGEGL